MHSKSKNWSYQFAKSMSMNIGVDNLQVFKPMPKAVQNSNRESFGDSDSTSLTWEMFHIKSLENNNENNDQRIPGFCPTTRLEARKKNPTTTRTAKPSQKRHQDFFFASTRIPSSLRRERKKRAAVQQALVQLQKHTRPPSKRPSFTTQPCPNDTYSSPCSEPIATSFDREHLILKGLKKWGKEKAELSTGMKPYDCTENSQLKKQIEPSYLGQSFSHGWRKSGITSKSNKFARIGGKNRELLKRIHRIMTSPPAASSSASYLSTPSQYSPKKQEQHQDHSFSNDYINFENSKLKDQNYEERKCSIRFLLN